MIFLLHSMHSKDVMAGAHTINQHGTSYYGYMKFFKSKVFSLINPHKHGKIKQVLHIDHKPIIKDLSAANNYQIQNKN